MDSFVGRRNELEYLEKCYASAPEVCAIFGRIRLGKTALLREFCKDKPYIYIRGTEGPPEEMLRSMEDAVSRYAGRKVRLDDVQDLMPTVKRLCSHNKAVLVLDHYSELLEAFPELSSYLSSFLRHDLFSTRLLIVACDSDSTVFRKALDKKEIKPMSYLECIGFHSEYTPMQHLKAFGMVGGAPAYHFLLEGDPDQAMKSQFVDRMSVFALEVESMVNSETVNKAECIRILHAMGRGAESFREIQERTGMSLGACTRALQDMEHKGIVSRESSDDNIRNSIYSFGSNLLSFYYSVIVPARPSSDFFIVDDSYARALELAPRHMEKVFKSVCAEYVGMRYSCRTISKIRRHDGTSPKGVDFVAQMVDNHMVKRTAVVFCRLSGEPMGMSDLGAMKESARNIKGGNMLYMMFSGCGFDKPLTEEAASSAGIVLTTLEDLYRAGRSRPESVRTSSMTGFRRGK